MFQYRLVIFLLFAYDAEVVVCIQAESASRITLQIAGETLFGRYGFAFHIYFFGSDVSQRVLLTGFEADFSRHLGGKGGKLIHAVGIYVDGLQVAHGKAGFLASGILGDYMFVGFYGTVIVIVLVVKQADFCSCFTADGTLGILAEQFAEGGDSLGAVVALYVGAPFFVKGIDGIRRIGIFDGKAVQHAHLFRIVLLHAIYQR